MYVTGGYKCIYDTVNQTVCDNMDGTKNDEI